MSECRAVRRLLALRPVDWNADERVRIEAHLATCTACPALAHSYAEQDRLLQVAPRAGLTPPQRRRLFALLERERRGHKARARLSVALGTVIGLASLAALILGVGFLLQRGPSDTGVVPNLTPTVSAGPSLPASETAFLLTLSPAPSTAPRPAGTQTASATATSRFESRWVDLITPITGDIVSSPIQFSGRTNTTPENPVVFVRLYTENWEVLAETTTIIQGELGKPGTFHGQIDFSGHAGPATIEVEAGGATCVTHVTLTETP